MSVVSGDRYIGVRFYVFGLAKELNARYIESTALIASIFNYSFYISFFTFLVSVFKADKGETNN